MPSTLRDAVRSALSSLLQDRQASHGDVAVDVYRALREEAHLLLERERACDALDADPFELTRASSAEVDGTDCSDCKGGDEDEAHDAEDLREKQKNKELIARVKDMLHVVSCTRTSTPEGYSAVRAVVQLDNDGKMQGVEGHVRLHFAFLREPQHDGAGKGDGDDAEKVFYADADDYFEEEAEKSGQNDNGGDEQPAKKRKRTITGAKDTTEENNETDDEISGNGDEQNVGESSSGFAPKTIVTYQIEYSVDYGKKEKLLGVDIYAPGEFPSVEEAVPLIDDGEEGEERDGSGDEAQKCDDGKCCNGNAPAKRDGSNAEDEFDDVEMSDDCGSHDKDPNIGSGNGDRFGIFIDPEAVVAFLDRVNLNLNEQSVFYFLLTFPFYEHEWDIAGFLLGALEYDDEEDIEVGEETVEREDCKEGCEGDQPCCLPCNTHYEKVTGESSGGFAPKTIVTYQIEYSVDYGKKEKLLGVDIYAPGEFPSIEEAVPLIDDGEEGEERDGQGDEALKRDDEKFCNGDAPAKRDGTPDKGEFEDVEMSDDGGSCDKDPNIDGGNGDRFGIFIDPEAVVAFLDRVNLNLNEQSVFYFLLTFPFYEHEWDIAEFVRSALEYDDDDSETGEGNAEREDCKEGCEGDQPCCLPCR